MGNKVLHIKKVEGKPGSVYYPFVTLSSLIWFT